MEIWRDIVEYEGKYEVSSKGRVRSLPRTVIGSGGRPLSVKGRIMKARVVKGGYMMLKLSSEGIANHIKVHSLVAKAFLVKPISNERIVIDHIDEDPTNNTLTNIRYLTNRENSTRRFRRHGYIGITKRSEHRWQARIYIGGKSTHLGVYPTAKEASAAYEDALFNYNNELNECRGLSKDNKGDSYIS